MTIIRVEFRSDSGGISRLEGDDAQRFIDLINGMVVMSWVHGGGDLSGFAWQTFKDEQELARTELVRLLARKGQLIK